MAALVYEMLRERSEMVRGERREGKMSFFVTKKIGLNLFLSKQMYIFANRLTKKLYIINQN